MKVNHKAALLLSALLCICSLSACFGGNKDKGKTTQKLDADKINKQYEEIANNAVDSDAQSSAENFSVSKPGFSAFDFTFTSPDDTNAFSMDKNSFAKITPGGSYNNYAAKGSEVMTYEPNYKTAKGLDLTSGVANFITAYAITDGNAVYYDAGSGTYQILSGGVYSGRITALYGLKQDGTYTLLNSDNALKYVTLRDTNAEGMYIDPEVVLSSFPDYSGLASIDLATNGSGGLNEVDFYRFDK